MYDLAMTIYFGMYGATMTTNCPFFWGPDSIMMLPYMSAPMCATGNFFARMVGINFAIMTLGYAKLGVSKDAWIKQTMLFHVGTIPVFYMMCVNSDGSEFTPWVWMVQIAMNIGLAAWGVLLRRPLFSSRCSRWHRVPRPRRLDGATCHAIDAMPHAARSKMVWKASSRASTTSSTTI